jgi:hypothetical protein
MINTAFVDQAQGDTRQKLQKLEGFTGMNANQLLEGVTKVFVNQDQEGKWETNRMMNRKVDLLAAALVEWAGPGRLIHATAGAIIMDDDWRPWGVLTRPREELGRNQCAYCRQEGH